MTKELSPCHKYELERKMRLFIAIQLSDEIKKSITETMHDMKRQGVKGRYTPTPNLHLTLAFIGETDHPSDVKEALKDLKFKPFRLALSDMGCFGDILWSGVRGSQGLSGAAKAVRDALDAAGIAYDKKKFEPHITIVRDFKGNKQQIKAPKGEMMVKKLSLMKSAVKDGKRVYTEMMAIGQ